MQVVEDAGCLGKLAGTVAVVTGGSKGLGLQMCKALHVAGVTLVIGVVDEEEGRSALQEIYGQDGGATSPLAACLPLDLASLQSVHNFARRVRKEHDKIHFLFNNAGARRLSLRYMRKHWVQLVAKCALFLGRLGTMQSMAQRSLIRCLEGIRLLRQGRVQQMDAVRGTATPLHIPISELAMRWLQGCFYRRRLLQLMASRPTFRSATWGTSC